MKESDQVQLSRFVDGDLSPLERKGVESMLENDPAARRLANEFALIRNYVRELPRESLNVDLVPLIRSAETARPWLSFVIARSRSAAGMIAASVLIACFSLAGYLSIYGNRSKTEQLAFESLPSLRQQQAAPAAPAMTSSAGVPAAATSAAADSPEIPETAKPAEAIAPQIAMTPVELGITARSITTPPGAAAGQSIGPVGDAPQRLRTKFDEFLNSTDQIDRRHTLRLHVASASERQLASILKVISEFKEPETNVMEKESTQKTDKTSSITYFALIPTGQMASFRKALKDLPGIELELDKPDESLFRNAERGDGFVHVRKRLMETAENVGDRIVQDSVPHGPGEHKKPAPNADIVPDAISMPLKADAEDQASKGTLDEVLVLIRTDPLRVETDDARPKSSQSKKK